MRDLRAVRFGDVVRLTFTAPTTTTDRQSLTGKHGPVPLIADLCRVEAARCIGFARLPIAPGQRYETQDTLPPALTVGVPRTLAYRVRVENAAGRDAGNSREAVTAAGVAPPAITGLQATTAAQGIRLTWQRATAADPVRVEAQPETTASNGVRQAAPRLLQLPPASTASDPGGAIDPEPAAGTRVGYRVYRQRMVTVDGSSPSGSMSVPLNGAAATIAAKRGPDVFPPAAPTGLLAIAVDLGNNAPAVTLSWEPNTEPDVVGYHVYRATGSGEFQRISKTVVRGVSFQDAAVRAGDHVRYTVTALDRAGNESAHSASAEADAR